ncbi:hypothetical protein [Streptococcus uberis]|uniref:hypothetical protein n=2 Tax=Streptococcus uberis TaxID=1349 RepID=UPI00193A4CD0|nr:hypothetical protein [Streptococcus uberis]
MKDDIDYFIVMCNKMISVCNKIMNYLFWFSQITFDQLINESLLIPNEVQLINALSNFIDFQASNIFGHFSSFQIASLMVKKGFGYVIINKGSVMSEDKDLCFRVLEPHIYIESKLIWRKTKNPDKKLDYFITQLNKHIFELTSESKMKDQGEKFWNISH